MQYSDLTANDDVLKLTRRSTGKAASSCTATRDGVYCFSSTAFNAIEVRATGNKVVVLTVPDQNRELHADWVNDKILYLEMWFNPHFGAFWLYDAEKQRVVYRQRQSDGVQDWWHCRKDPPP